MRCDGMRQEGLVGGRCGRQQGHRGRARRSARAGARAQKGAIESINPPRTDKPPSCRRSLFLRLGTCPPIRGARGATRPTSPRQPLLITPGVIGCIFSSWPDNVLPASCRQRRRSQVRLSILHGRVPTAGRMPAALFRSTTMKKCAHRTRGLHLNQMDNSIPPCAFELPEPDSDGNLSVSGVPGRPVAFNSLLS